MNKRFPILAIFIAIVLFVTAFGAFVVQAQTSERTAPAAASYEAVLGKSLNDSDVADFIASNRCEGAGQFHLCNAAGMPLVTGEGQKVETVYLYPNASSGFAAYNGTLPLGLSPSDTLASVEDKLGQPRVSQVPQAGWVPGVPDQSGTPDHIHTWAIYKRFDVTVVYNSPSATDKSATIYAILVSK